MVIEKPNDPSHRFSHEGATKRRRTWWAVGIVLLIAVAAAIGYIAAVGGDWRGAAHMADAATDEAAITARIESELALSDKLSAASIDVATQGGVVRLRGTVQSEDVKRRAVDIAESIDGVERVEDQLLVENVDQPTEQSKTNERSQQ
jgi:hypothetical protein